MGDTPTPIRTEVNWMHGYANTPDITVHVDEAWDFPSPYSTWPHRALEDDGRGVLYLATKDIWAHFVYDASEADKSLSTRSRGACTGELLLQDGSRIEVTSGWSSGADCINHYLEEADQIVDVTLRGGEKYKSLGRAGVAIRKDALEPLLPDGVYLVDKPLRGPCWVPSVSPDEYRKADPKTSPAIAR